MVLNDSQRQTGKDNFSDAVRISRRDLIGLGASLPAVTAFYWGYERMNGSPVRVGVIGTGDQGCAHIASMNPEFLKVVAYADARPSNQKRGRLQLEAKYGPDARKVDMYEDYKKLLARGDVELVIIALPLFLHAPVAIEAMKAGKHVLCEKLMAKTVMDCKRMVRVSRQTNRLLAVGHQRHYSYLYANALEVVRQKDIIGDVRHLRAFWHRNQTGGGKPGAEKGEYDGWRRSIPSEDRVVDPRKYGFKSLEELVRWRLYARTGGGLMAELGSHQLDACGIFISGILGETDSSSGRHKPVYPVSVSGVGVKSFFTDDREIEDHVFLNYEYPEKIVVSYSCISTNDAESYGEQVMGTKGTLITLAEKDVYLFKERSSKDTRIQWGETRIAQPVTTSTSTTKWTSDVGVPDTITSRGYREEQEHMAYLIRNPGKGQPRCNGPVALGDAVVTLSSTLAMRDKRRLEFKPEWFNADSDEVPDPGEATTT